MGESFNVFPIGYVKNKTHSLEDVPSEGLPSSVVIGHEYADALNGLSAGMYVYIITIFHLADGSIQTGSSGTIHEIGAFAIRSSCRPNRLGMTLSRITLIKGNEIFLEWLDFLDGTPVIDIKRYNWRWECIFSNPRDNRVHIERQLDETTLTKVLKRPAVNFSGADGLWLSNVALGFARLVRQFGLFIANPANKIFVEGNIELIEAVQGITGASLGNGRLKYIISDESKGLVEIIDNGIKYSITVGENGADVAKVSE